MFYSPLPFFAAITAIIVSCDKAVKVPVYYTVQTNHDSIVRDIFIPDTGTYDLQILVKYMSGYPQDPVKLKITGLPSDISVTPDTVNAVPTYTQDFVFYTNHATHGTYHVTLTGSAPEEISQTYYFSITVVPANCASLLFGTLTCRDSCTHAGKYSYTATAWGNGSSDTLIVNNFGGYGTNTYATAVLNCDNDSVMIPGQYIGNGVTLSGKGTYTTTGMVISYSATGTPIASGSDNCIVTFSK